ncbi:MAG: gluconate 2-dehydrogenase subunit 3 family protein [Acidimicrobiia bacterium]
MASDLRFFTASEHEVVAAAAERLIPPARSESGGAHPGARAGGAAEYIDRLLGAFTVDPPLIFAGGPFSGRAGGTASFADFTPLSPLEELAWRTRIEGSQGIAAREFNGPVIGWQEHYRTAIAALGDDFPDVDGEEQDRRLGALREFRDLLYEHACEGLYGAPEYGGNRDGSVWRAIEFPGDAQPRGYTDDEVTDA